MRALIKSSFALTGRGTMLVVELIDGQVAQGDPILCPLVSGDVRPLIIRAVEWSESRRATEAYPVLVVEGLLPSEVAIGKELT